ncbi:MAG: DUF4395 domain-containing protein [Solirubrobacterales bacterium]|nr:DUF4395 domain-containing protein [Solirubrobacterales bacterium]
MSQIFSFPNPVNEKAARVVAGGVVLISLLGLATGWMWLLAVLAVGFWLRVASGPRFSPLGLLATKVISPRLGEPKRVPGPPKRFAQTIGAVTTTVGAILALGFGLDAAGYVVFGIMALFAAMESIFAFCVGCQIFALLMRAGIIPGEVCEACADISLRRA